MAGKHRRPNVRNPKVVDWTVKSLQLTTFGVAAGIGTLLATHESENQPADLQTHALVLVAAEEDPPDEDKPTQPTDSQPESGSQQNPQKAPEGQQDPQDTPDGQQDQPEGEQSPQDSPEGQQDPQDTPEGLQSPEDAPEGEHDTPEEQQDPQDAPEGEQDPQDVPEGQQDPQDVPPEQPAPVSPVSPDGPQPIKNLVTPDGEVPVNAEPPPGQEPTEETDADQPHRPANWEELRHSENNKVTVHIGIVAIERNWGFIRREYNDGSVQLTATNGVGFGLEYNPSSKSIKVNGMGPEAGIKVNAMLHLSGGDTFKFTSKQEADKYEGMVRDLAMQGEKIPPRCGGGLVDCLPRDSDFKSPPVPDKKPEITYTSVGGEFSATAEAGITRDLELGKLSPGGIKSHAEAKVKISGQKITGTDNSDPNNPLSFETSVFTAEGEASGGMFASQSARGSSQGAVRSVRDKDGKLVRYDVSSSVEVTGEASLSGSAKVKLAQLRGAGAKSRNYSTLVTTRVTTLIPQSDEERQVIETHLNGNRDTPAWEENRAKYLKMVDNAIVHESVMASDKNKTEAGLEISFLGLTFGVKYERETDDQNLLEMKYKGAADANGNRPWRTPKVPAPVT